MKCEINGLGILTITAENHTEGYALLQWYENTGCTQEDRSPRRVGLRISVVGLVELGPDDITLKPRDEPDD